VPPSYFITKLHAVIIWVHTLPPVHFLALLFHFPKMLRQFFRNMAYDRFSHIANHLSWSCLDMPLIATQNTLPRTGLPTSSGTRVWINFCENLVLGIISSTMQCLFHPNLLACGYNLRAVTNQEHCDHRNMVVLACLNHNL